MDKIGHLLGTTVSNVVCLGIKQGSLAIFGHRKFAKLE
jgi:hypothetical protein